MGPFSLVPFVCTLVTVFSVLTWHARGISAHGLVQNEQQVRFSWNEAQDAEEAQGEEEIKEAGTILGGSRNVTESGLSSTLEMLLDAMDVMQDRYFDVGTATWPSSIDWTAAVLGTHISASLSTIISSVDYFSLRSSMACSQALAWSDLINRYFAHTSIFYFGENSLSLRQQAYDDMLWVVLGWLEDVKLIDLFNSISAETQRAGNTTGHILGDQKWHGTQFKAPAAHRARTFYDLASQGWDSSLCGGGMLWSPYLVPYKNSITNELFISASISMYLYFPGDNNESPFLSTASGSSHVSSNPHDLRHLHYAIKAYDWLRNSNMTSPKTPGLYADGFHIHGWHHDDSGHIDPGTGNCDQLNSMVYTYNQAVVLTGLRGLWLAKGSKRYLDDGHDLISSAINATGWPETGSIRWAGLGRGGVLEDYCDSWGNCSQNGHTFKGIFFHHLAEFCRPLSPFEQDFLSSTSRKATADEDADGESGQAWTGHLVRCEGYRAWIAHNAHAAVVTRDEEGKFGMWWGQTSRTCGQEQQDEREQDLSSSLSSLPSIKPPPSPPLPSNAIDYQNQHDLSSTASPPLSSPFYPSRPVATATTPTNIYNDNKKIKKKRKDVNDRGRGRTVETQSGGLAVLRAMWQWEAASAADVTDTTEMVYGKSLIE